MTIQVTCTSPGCGRSFRFAAPAVPTTPVPGPAGTGVIFRAACPHCRGATLVSAPAPAYAVGR